MGMDKMKLRSLNKLAEKGFDTGKKISEIDMVTIRDYGLVGELSFIIEMQEAIKGDVLEYLMGSKDKEEVNEEAKYGEDE